jgi:hypothetical protein
LDLQALFRTLAVPAVEGSGERFNVSEVTGHNSYLLGRGSDGAPAVLIRNVAKGNHLMHVELENLHIAHGIKCRIRLPGGNDETAEVSLIRCSADADLEFVFLRLMGGLIQEFGDPSPEDLAQLVAQLVDLFRALTQPPKKSVQGLWGELLLIAQSTSPIDLLVAWHADPADMYDFNSGQQRIEVKTSASRRRSHHFRLEQLLPPAGTDLMICSFTVEQAGGGQTIADLVTEIFGQIVSQPGLAVRLETVIAETLGHEWRSGAHLAFDREVARDSTRFLAAADIPSIPPSAVPETVTNVRFEVNVDGVPGMPFSWLIAKGGLLAAAVPG